MKNVIPLLLFGLWTSFSAHAQCPGAPLTLTTQAQVNNFPTNYPGCTEMEVSLTINGSNITNLNGLSQLESLVRSLFIFNNPSLTSLAGLSNLSNIGAELTVDNCDVLTNLNGLENVPFIGGTLTITGNATLSNMNALLGIQYINGSLLVSQNPALTTLAGLDNAAFTGRFLQISNNNALTSISSLDNMAEVGNNANTNGRFLSIGSNPNLTTIDGLHNLVSVGTDFEIVNNGNLVSLDAFNSLETIGGEFAITGNPDLTSITEFGAITSIGGSLTISNNNLLGDCATQGICDYLEGPGVAIIGSNDPGCNSVAEVEAECLLLPVKLTSLRARARYDGVYIDWQTASEQNNSHFLVEHSIDGQSFVPVGEVPGHGTTATANTYQFLHKRPAEGHNYYRLKQVDFDGKFEYSRIVSAMLRSETEIALSPNPTDGPVFLRGSIEEDCFIRVTDGTGRVVWSQPLPENRMIDLANQPDGIYVVEITAGDVRTTRRIVKE